MAGTKHRLRKEYEQQLLPRLFYTEKDRFVYVCANNNTVLFDMLEDIFENHPLKNPYTREQFTAQLAKADEDLLVLKISFPEPEKEGECACAWLLFDPEFHQPRYYCMEKGKKEEYILCSWTPELKHVRYGKCGIQGSEDLRRCMLLYLQEKDHRNRL